MRRFLGPGFLGVIKGVGLLLLMHLLAIAGLWVLLYLADLLVYILSGVANGELTQVLYRVWVFGLLMFGLVQWLYVLPVGGWEQREGPEPAEAQQVGPIRGGMGGAIATCFLNGSYFLLNFPLPS